MIIVKNGIMAIDGKLSDLIVEYTQIHAEIIHRAPEMAMAVEAYLADLTEEVHRSGTINREQMVEMYKGLTRTGMLEDFRKEWNKI
jgi:hypothetical protein